MSKRNVVLDTGSGAETPAAAGTMLIAPFVEHADGSTWIHGTPKSYSLTYPASKVPLTVGEYFWFTPVDPAGKQKLGRIPSGAGDITYADLPYIDPTTLDPAAVPPEPAWTEALVEKVDKADRPITFEQFGAVGDGVADDTAAVQAAYNSVAITLGGNGTPALRIESKPGSTYRLTSTIDVIQRTVWFEGCGGSGNPSNFAAKPGKGTTFRWDGAAGQPMFHLKDTYDCGFEHVFFQGNIANPPSEGIYNEGYVSQEGNHGLKLKNVRFGSWPWTNPATPSGTVSMTNGVRYGGINGNNDQFAFRDVTFNNCSTGLSLPNSQSIWGETDNVLFENCTVGLYSAASHNARGLHFQGCGTDVSLASTAVLDVAGWGSENSGLIFTLADQSGLNVRGGHWTIMSPMTGAAYFALANLLANNLSLDGVEVVFNITAIPLKVRGTYSPQPYTIRIKGCKGLDSLAKLDIQGYGTADVTFLDIDTQGIKYRRSITAVPLSAPIQTKTANYTLSTADRSVIFNGSGKTATLPDPTNCPTDTEFRIKNMHATALTVASAGTSKTIDGAASQTLEQWSTGTYVCDGTQWLSVAGSDAVPKSLLTTKGDLLIATAAGAPARLGAGANGTLLLPDSTQTSGWRFSTTKAFEGTGSPEGVVTAPIGSTYTDTAATNGAVKWTKLSGSGNTGWTVSLGDTGLRNSLAALYQNSCTASDGASYTSLRRVGSLVTLRLGIATPSGWVAGTVAFNIPAGFRMPVTSYLPPAYGGAISAYGAGPGGDIQLFNTGANAGIRFLWTYMTEEAWPTTLP